MYFESRTKAGEILAGALADEYRYENCTVVALSEGSVLVGEEIAKALHCTLNLLIIEDIEVPGESVSFGGVSQGGGFTYNSSFSSGEIDEYTSEFHGYLDEKKREAFQKINRLIGEGGAVDIDMLRNRVVILVADGISEGSAVDVAVEFLKPISVQKLVIATPVASIPAVDKLHLLADELHILDVKENYLDTDHYYEDNTVPPRDEIIKHINEVILNWD